MKNKKIYITIFCTLTLFLGSIISQAQVLAPAPRVKLRARPILRPHNRQPENKFSVNKLTSQPLIFTATTTNIRQGPTARSFPPIYNFTITVKNINMIRGNKVGKLIFHYQARQHKKPNIPNNTELIFAGHSDKNGGIIISIIAEKNKKNLEIAKTASILPIGWQKTEKNIILSPWSKKQKSYWPKNCKLTSKIKCAKSGRPALMTGNNIIIEVDQIIPEKIVKYTNEYGDGKFTIKVTNISDKPVTIPALLKSKNKILWKQSLVFIVHDKSYIMDDMKQLPSDIEAVTLKANQTISTEINTLELQNMRWPQGGRRIYYKFCLGEQSADNFFYYLTRWHGKLLPKK